MPSDARATLSRLLRDSTLEVEIGASWARHLSVRLTRFLALEMAPGTELLARVDGRRVEVSSEPPATISSLRRVPELRLERAAYEFDRGRFVLTSRTAPAIVRKLVDPLAARVLDREVRPLLPSNLRAGYSPEGDPNLGRTVSSLGAVLGSFAGVRSPHAHEGADLPALLDGAREVHGRVKLAAADDARWSLSRVDALELFVPVGTRFTVKLATRGKVANASLERIAVRAHDRGALLRLCPTNGDAPVPIAELRSFVASAGRELTIESSMLFDPIDESETAAQLAQRLDPTRELGLPVRIDELRRLVYAVLARELRDRLDDTLLRLEGLLPGVSLRTVLRAESADALRGSRNLGAPGR